MTSAPGWHPDPEVPGQLRYWEGTAWTEHTAPGPAAAPAQAPTMARPQRIMSDKRTNGPLVIIAWVMTVITVGYFLPWAIAETRGKSNSMAIGLLTFLLGWTIIGWIVALVMACGSHQKFVA